MDPTFLTLEEVVRIHDAGLARFGGLSGMRDLSLLESALGTPQQSFGGQFLHEDLFAMAAAYAYHIAENQPFLDGNKRAGLGAALVFLDMNGIDLDDPEERLYDALIAVAEHRMSKGDLAALFRGLAAGE
jgi:death-on-curing protein